MKSGQLRVDTFVAQDHVQPLESAAVVGGINVHAAIAIDGREKKRLERMCRYLARPPIAQDRLELRDDGRVEYTMKKIWRDGTRHDPWYYAYAAAVAFNQERYAEGLAMAERVPPTLMVDLPAYRAVAHLRLGNEAMAREQLELFVEQFREKIAPGRSTEPGEALRWVKHVNPYLRSEDQSRLFDGLSEVAALLDEPPPSVTSPAELDVFRQVGSLWQMSFAGRDVHVAHLKGFCDIATLLDRPHQELHCSELMGQLDATGADDAIDPRAKSAYEGRLRELGAELDEAEEFNDAGRAEQLRAERDALIKHLEQAMGLGGRARKLGAPAERARSAVTQLIRGAIKKLEVAHPQLAAHPDASIQTGTFCSYCPDSVPDWHM